MSNFNGLYARGSWLWFLHHNQFFDVIVQKSDYDIKKLIRMQKLKSRTAGLKSTKIGHVDGVSIGLNVVKKIFGRINGEAKKFSHVKQKNLVMSFQSRKFARLHEHSIQKTQ